MAGEGLDEAGVRGGDVPNVDRPTSRNGYKSVIGGEAAAIGIMTGRMEFGHNRSGIGGPDCDCCPVT